MGMVAEALTGPSTSASRSTTAICHPEPEGEIMADFGVIVTPAAESHVEKSTRDGDIAQVIEPLRRVHAAFTR